MAKSRIKAVAFDLDGVVYRGNAPVKGVANAIDCLKKSGIRVFFMSNNSTKARGACAQKLAGMGIAAKKHDIYTSAHAAADYCALNGYKTAYVIGEGGLVQELQGAGIRVVKKTNPDCVVVGLDRGIVYEKIGKAANAIGNGAAFVATNTDGSYPHEKGFAPGAGAIVAAVSVSCSKPPDFVAGKPHNYMITELMRENRLKKSELLIVGDTIYLYSIEGPDVVGIEVKNAGYAQMMKVLFETMWAQSEDRP